MVLILTSGAGLMRITTVLPTLMSLVALLFSGYSLYESALRAPTLSIFVAPRIDYADRGRPENSRELFVLPITIANSGARGATVLAINLEVFNPRSKRTRKFYAARLGTWAEKPWTPFAPVVLVGRGIYTHALQFEPLPGESGSRLLDQDAGSYTLKLSLDIAAAQGGTLDSASVAPLTFDMQIGELDYRYFQGTGTMEMWATDNKSPVSGQR